MFKENKIDFGSYSNIEQDKGKYIIVAKHNVTVDHTLSIVQEAKYKVEDQSFPY